MGREVAESVFDSLMMEMVLAYSSSCFADMPDLAARQIEAIGYQVGVQLSKRELLCCKIIISDGSPICVSIHHLKIPIHQSAQIVDSSAQTTSMYLYLPCGIIRGALTNFGIPCAVSADSSSLPACSFVVRIKA